MLALSTLSNILHHNVGGLNDLTISATIRLFNFLRFLNRYSSISQYFRSATFSAAHRLLSNVDDDFLFALLSRFPVLVDRLQVSVHFYSKKKSYSPCSTSSALSLFIEYSREVPDTLTSDLEFLAGVKNVHNLIVHKLSYSNFIFNTTTFFPNLKSLTIKDYFQVHDTFVQFPPTLNSLESLKLIDLETGPINFSLVTISFSELVNLKELSVFASEYDNISIIGLSFLALLSSLSLRFISTVDLLHPNAVISNISLECVKGSVVSILGCSNAFKTANVDLEIIGKCDELVSTFAVNIWRLNFWGASIEMSSISIQNLNRLSCLNVSFPPEVPLFINFATLPALNSLTLFVENELSWNLPDVLFLTKLEISLLSLPNSEMTMELLSKCLYLRVLKLSFHNSFTFPSCFFSSHPQVLSRVEELSLTNSVDLLSHVHELPQLKFLVVRGSSGKFLTSWLRKCPLLSRLDLSCPGILVDKVLENKLLEDFTLVFSQALGLNMSHLVSLKKFCVRSPIIVNHSPTIEHCIFPSSLIHFKFTGSFSFVKSLFSSITEFPSFHGTMFVHKVEEFAEIQLLKERCRSFEAVVKSKIVES
ncbi:hypothetical protein RCL1_003197 [Eukaryota sp. TZLM3-RCL]